ncbi:unnamed protein product [Caenorhabditis bovis]|uniref:Uncharacterized protein n=1 Tax=Caenorhabditis bovis TaxID=2654633 RepID=A0A8S1EFW1_9PELO|nr:unnamed protein product [Caenorhabditis bovis]
MLSIPWWLFGTVPDDENSVEITEEVQTDEGCDEFFTPQFKAPSKTLPVAEIDSSPPESDKDTKKIFNYEQRSSLERCETEMLSPDANEDPFFGIDFDNVRAFRPIHSDVVDQRSSEEHLLDEIIQLETQCGDEELNEEVENPQSSDRDFPLFFTSFNDTTVIFNSTITGDIDLDSIHTPLTKSDSEESNFIFKNNKILQEDQVIKKNSNDPTKIIPKKSRSQNKKHKLENQELKSEVSTKSFENVTKPKRQRKAQVIVEPVTPKNNKAVVYPPTPIRRITPSRKAKEKPKIYHFD